MRKRPKLLRYVEDVFSAAVAPLAPVAAVIAAIAVAARIPAAVPVRVRTGGDIGSSLRIISRPLRPDRR